MRKILKASIITFSIVSMFTFSSLVLAQGGPQQPGGGPVQDSAGTVRFENPLGDAATYEAVVANVVQGVLGIVGLVALIIFIYGGIVWMTSLGNAERVKQGRDTLVWGTIGIIVVFASFAIVNLILGALDST